MKRHILVIWLILLLGTCSGMWWLVFSWGRENWFQLAIGILAAIGLLTIHAHICARCLGMETLKRKPRPETPPHQMNGHHNSEPSSNGTGQHRDE